jgi:hypothetical protein
MYMGEARMQGAGGSVGGVVNAMDVGKRMPELPAQVDNLERGINYLEESLNELSNRLEGVVRPVVPEPASGTQQMQAVPPSSGYASTIHGQAGRVTRLTDRMQDLLRRLEV